MIWPLAAGLLVSLAPGAAAVGREDIPLPHGWIGTTSEWLRGFGIAFALLNLLLLVFAWRSLRQDAPRPPLAAGSWWRSDSSP